MNERIISTTTTGKVEEMDFPRSIFLKSNDNNKFLRYRREEGSNHAFLQFSQDEGDKDAEIQCLKFEVEKAKTVEGLVHIRNCYNHKYWVRKSADTKWIVAEANEPEEDQSKWSCTLFKLILIDADDTDNTDAHAHKKHKIRLMHVDQFGQNYASVSKTGDDHDSELLLDDDDSKSAGTKPSDGQVFTMYNASTAILPEYVAFMGHNNHYCATTVVNGVQYLELKTTDVGLEGVSHRIYQTFFPPGFNIQNTFTRGDWMLDNPFIVTNVRDWTNILNMITTFALMDLGSNFIAIRCDLNGRFVQSSSGQGMENVLSASTSTISNQAMFRVAEPVRLRVINNVKFDLDDSRIYNVSTVDKYSDFRENYSSVEQTGSFGVSYTISRSKSWNHSVSVATGISASWTSGIPYVGDFGVEVSYERTESREWGVEETEEQTVEYQQSLTIPPRKKLTLKLVATKAFCDVPFTCDVQDTMMDGSIRRYTKRDGLFMGSNEYNFVTQIKEEDL